MAKAPYSHITENESTSTLAQTLLSLRNLLPLHVLPCDSSALGITERSISYTHGDGGLLYPHKYVSSLV